MANRKETLELNIEGNADKKLKDLEREGKKADKAVDDVGTSASKTGASLRNAAFAAAAFGTAAVAAGKQALETFGRIQAAQGRLNRAVETTGGTQADYNRLLRQAKKNADQYGGTLDENITGLEILTRQSKSSRIAQRDFALAQDIAAAETMDLLQAVEILRKARNGEVEELKNLNGLNKDQAEALNRVEGSARRGAEGIALLTAEYEGSAEKLFGVNEQLASMESSLDRLAGAGGGALAEFGEALGLLSEEAGEETFLGKMASEAELLVEALDEAEVGLVDVASLAIQTVSALTGQGGGMGSGLSVRVAQARDRILEERESGEGSVDAPTAPDLAFDSPEGQKKLRQAEKRRELRDKEREREAQEAKRKAQQRARELAQAEAEALRENRSIVEEAFREAEEDLREQQARSFREELAQLRLQGRERAALEMELAGGDATDGEKELALEKFDMEQQAQERELELRERIAELKLQDKDLEADILQIKNSTMTAAEKELAIENAKKDNKEKQKKIDEARMKALQEGVQAASGLAGGVLAQLGMEEEAKRGMAAVDALVYGYKATAAFVAGDIAHGIGFTQAAISAGAVAAGAGSSGGGSGGGKSSAPPKSAERTAQRDERTRASLNGDREPTKTENNFYFRSVASPSPRDVRQIGDANEMSQTQRIGGRGRR